MFKIEVNGHDNQFIREIKTKVPFKDLEGALIVQAVVNWGDEIVTRYNPGACVHRLEVRNGKGNHLGYLLAVEV